MTRIGPRAINLILGAVMTSALLAGCGRSQRVATENDRLRARVADLEDDVRALERANAELEAKLAEADRAPTEVTPIVRDNTPRVSSISVGRLSHLRDDDGDGVPDRAVIYIKPIDGRGRFVQMVGDLSVHVARLPADGEARTLGRIALDAAQVRDAYRSSFSGTHYTVEVPVTDATPDQSGHVQVEFTDGLTGQRHEASTTL